MRKLISILLIICILMSSSLIIPIYAEPVTPTVVINGEVIKFDSAPTTVNGITMVQAKPIFQKLNIKLVYDAKSKIWTGTKGKDVISFQIGIKTAVIYGKKITLSNAPLSIRTDIFIPINMLNSLKIDEIKQIGAQTIIRDFSLSGCETFDTDKDGLTDYQEINKYFTNPDKIDSDNDGIPDGDWNERREYTYTIKTSSSFVLPGNTLELNNNVQDGRIVSQKENIVDVETIIFPYTSYDNKEYESLNWKNENSVNKELQEYLRPSPQINWDTQFQKDLLNDLHKDNIYPEKLSDLELIKKVSSWLNARQKYIYGYSSLAVDFKDGKVYFPPEVKDRYFKDINTYDDLKDVKTFVDNEIKKGKSIDQILNDMPLGKQSYYKHIVGECTEHAVLWGTVLRALGIPTRVTVVLPILAQGNKAQQELIKSNIKDDAIRDKIINSFCEQDGAVGSHYFNEVYIGNRWISLDGVIVNKNTNVALSPSVQYARMVDPIYFDYYNNWYQLGSGKIESLSPNGVPYRLNGISDMYGVHYKESMYWKKLEYLRKASENKNKYQPISILIAPEGDILDSTKDRYPSYYISGGANWSQKDINQAKRIAVFDDSTSIRFSKEMASLFASMKKEGKNYLYVKAVEGKLLVYLKAENKTKLKELIQSIHTDNYYIEQYVNFDKGEKPFI